MLRAAIPENGLYSVRGGKCEVSKRVIVKRATNNPYVGTSYSLRVEEDGWGWCVRAHDDVREKWVEGS